MPGAINTEPAKQHGESALRCILSLHAPLTLSLLLLLLALGLTAAWRSSPSSHWLQSCLLMPPRLAKAFCCPKLRSVAVCRTEAKLCHHLIPFASRIASTPRPCHAART